MKTTLSLLFFFFAATVLAQGDFGNQSMSIPPAQGNISIAPSNSDVPKSIFDKPLNPVSSGTIPEKEVNLNFGKASEFANPGDPVRDKLNKRRGGEENVALRENQYMGDFKTKSVFVKISYRDFGAFDGDLIKVSVNDKVVKSQIMMEPDFEGFELTLQPGFNKIDFEALNQGTSGPNTAEFNVYDDKGELITSNQWNLATGFKATVIVVKE